MDYNENRSNHWIYCILSAHRSSQRHHSQSAATLHPYDVETIPRGPHNTFKMAPMGYDSKCPEHGPVPPMYVRAVSRDSNDYAIIGDLIGPQVHAHGGCHGNTLTDTLKAGSKRPMPLKYDIPQYYELDQGTPRREARGAEAERAEHSNWPSAHGFAFVNVMNCCYWNTSRQKSIFQPELLLWY